MMLQPPHWLPKPLLSQHCQVPVLKPRYWILNDLFQASKEEDCVLGRKHPIYLDFSIDCASSVPFLPLA